MPKKTNFEGPLRPGRGDQVLPPRLREPKMPVADVLEATIKKSVVDKMLASVEKRAYRRGFRRGRIGGFSAGYDSGFQNGRKEGSKDGYDKGFQAGGNEARNNFGRYNP